VNVIMPSVNINKKPNVLVPHVVKRSQDVSVNITMIITIITMVTNSAVVKDAVQVITVQPSTVERDVSHTITTNTNKVTIVDSTDVFQVKPALYSMVKLDAFGTMVTPTNSVVVDHVSQVNSFPYCR